MSSPKVTICIPVYNREDFIIKSLHSAQSQEIDDLEILIVDNDSNDRTREVVSAVKDKRIHLVRNKSNMGMFGNFNRCLELAQGEYIRYLCSDDLLTNQTVKLELKVMDNLPKAAVLSTRCELVDTALKPKRSFADHLKPGIYDGSSSIRNILWIFACYGYNPLNYPSGIMIRRDFARKAGYFNEQLSFSADLDFWLRLLEYGDLVIVDNTGCQVMLHPGSESNLLWKKGVYLQDHFIMAKHYLDLDDTTQRVSNSQILQGLGGRCLWFGLKSILMNDFNSFSIHWKMPGVYGISLPASMMGFARRVWLRMLLGFGIHLSLQEPKAFYYPIDEL